MSDTEITFTGAYTCTHHNDRQRAECPVCLVSALTAERAEAELATEREKAERYRVASLKLDAELAAERARLDYLSTRGFEHRHHATGDHLAYEFTISSTNELKDVTLREVIDAAMKGDRNEPRSTTYRHRGSVWVCAIDSARSGVETQGLQDLHGGQSSELPQRPRRDV
jgi:type IV secretory pathway VirD2 relaxase